MLLQRQAPAIHPLTTAHLAQTMTLLEMTSVELEQKVEAALATNPALELVEFRLCPTCRRKITGNTCPVCSRSANARPDQPIVFVSHRQDFQGYSSAQSHERPDEDYAQAADVEDLPSYVLRQIASDLQPSERQVAAFVLTNLNEDGLLAMPVVEIARYLHILPSRVDQVIRIIQRAEPLGVGSPTPQAALLVQLEALGEQKPVPPHAAQAIEKGLDLLSRRRYLELGRLLDIPTKDARALANFIRCNLNPFPARSHWGDSVRSSADAEIERNIYHSPDVVISRLNESDEDTLVVEIALPLQGSLRINPLFKQAIREAPADKADQWKNDLEQASLLVKCIQQRNHTLVRLMQRLTVLQKRYILHGDAYLQPITRASLSRELEVHESTISRAVSAKAVQLPNGRIVPLATFFDRSLNIRTALKKIIDEEIRPLSDTEIGKLLACQGYLVARRTVAKYRSMEGILPAHLRDPLAKIPNRERVTAAG